MNRFFFSAIFIVGILILTGGKNASVEARSGFFVGFSIGDIIM